MESVKSSDPEVTDTFAERTPLTPEEAAEAFVRRAHTVADELNDRNIETTAGFAACHGHKPKTQYNKNENNE